ncbi:MAG: DNA gyrase C-terminal beta-propeller domain-containing protein, partial [Sphaerochaetaceae bacterium]
DKILAELLDLEQKIAYYKDVLSDEKKILGVVESETRALPAQLSPRDRRRTEIIPQEIGETKDEDFIKKEDVVVLISNKGFAKRIPVDEYKAQARAGKGTKTAKLQEADFVEHMFVSSSHDYVLYVTNLGKAYYTKVYEIPEAGKYAKGTSIKNFLQMEGGEKITTIITFSDFRDDVYLMMATKHGVVKKVTLSNFVNAKARGIKGIILDEGDELLQTEFVSAGDQVMLITRGGIGLRFSADEVRPMGRATHGVRGIRLSDGDEVAGLLKVDPRKRILMLTENGQGKQVAYENFMCHGRGTHGQKIYRLGDKANFIVGALSVNEENDVVCVTMLGQTVRVHVKNISLQGRNAAGVKVVAMKYAEDHVVAIAATEYDEDEETEMPEQVPEASVSSGDETLSEKEDSDSKA